LTEQAVLTRSAAETQTAGADLAAQLGGGDIVLLWGDLGAGKTTFTQGIARGLGVRQAVQSPTFTLIAEYDAPRLGRSGQLVHIDLYRLEGEAQLDSIGLDEYLDRDDCVVVIEWPDRADVSTFPVHWSVHLRISGDDQREITVQEPGNE
jgi:tRNA threonylcarbamoyladenosine biosynthesis protein TsaE